MTHLCRNQSPLSCPGISLAGHLELRQGLVTHSAESYMCEHIIRVHVNTQVFFQSKNESESNMVVQPFVCNVRVCG